LLVENRLLLLFCSEKNRFFALFVFVFDFDFANFELMFVFVLNFDFSENFSLATTFVFVA
jgi:hypothetical protein